MNKEIKFILFDLGRVLIELNGLPYIRTLFPGRTDAEVHRKWISMPSIHKFETGKLTLPDFLIRAPKELGINMEADEFHELYGSWLVGEYPGASELIISLKRKFKIGCLSNTNEIHSKKLRERNFLDHFDDVFLSHEIGFMKPDERAYRYVVESWNARAQEILFFDDNGDNVEVAKRIGMEAYKVERVGEVIKVLKYLALSDFAPYMK